MRTHVHAPVFAQLPEQYNLAIRFGDTNFVNPWKALQDLLRETADEVVWIITTDQLPNFTQMLKKYNLDQYLVVDQRKDGQGTTNRNYLSKPLRLRTFVMKGAKK